MKELVHAAHGLVAVVVLQYVTTIRIVCAGDLLLSEKPADLEASELLQLSPVPRGVDLARLHNHPAGFGQVVQALHVGEAVRQLHNLRLLPVQPDSLFPAQPVDFFQTVPQIFLALMDQVGIIHIAAVFLHAQDFFHIVVDAAAVGDREDLRYLAADTEALFSERLNEAPAQLEDSLVLECRIQHFVNRSVENVVKVSAEIHQEDIPVVAAGSPVVLVKVMLQPVPRKGNPLAFERRAVVVNQASAQDRNQSVIAQRPLRDTFLEVYGLDVPFLSPFNQLMKYRCTEAFHRMDFPEDRAALNRALQVQRLS